MNLFKAFPSFFCNLCTNLTTDLIFCRSKNYFNFRELVPSIFTRGFVLWIFSSRVGKKGSRILRFLWSASACMVQIIADMEHYRLQPINLFRYLPNLQSSWSRDGWIVDSKIGWETKSTIMYLGRWIINRYYVHSTVFATQVVTY